MFHVRISSMLRIVKALLDFSKVLQLQIMMKNNKSAVFLSLRCDVTCIRIYKKPDFHPEALSAKSLQAITSHY